VVAAGILVNVNLVEWCVLALCIAVVLASELFNSALESLARAVNYDYDPDLADALDIASGAVLVAASGAAAIGVIILGFRAGMWLGWWGGYLLL
jgi:diacylglycerol kinase